ncbi:uncharacterized protein LOC135823178 [Sycon ciliatum]|uniref:uncharacterized protein LOC135823178 n=1 Tax=Sycon ciliatum TaxID=27933 RepID=UPI0020AC7F53
MAQPPSDYVQLKEGPVPTEAVDYVEYVPVGEDSHGYTEMIGKQKQQQLQQQQQQQQRYVKPSKPAENVFVPVHQRQASHSSKHSSENGRFDMPEYMNAASEEKLPLSTTTPVSDILTRNGVGGTTSFNPTYGNLPTGKTVQGSLQADDLPPPPPPNVSEDAELPFYSGVCKGPSPQPSPDLPPAVVNKKEKRLADSVLYTQQSVPSKGHGSSLVSRESTTTTDSSDEYHQRKQFVRTLFCALFVLFLMSAAAIGLCVYLLLSWPSDGNNNCSPCSTATTPPAPQINNLPSSVLDQTPVVDGKNDSLAVLAVEGMRSLEERLALLERTVIPSEDYALDKGVFDNKIQNAEAALASHQSSLRNFKQYQNSTVQVLEAMSAAVSEVHQNFTEAVAGFDQTLRDSRVFRNCKAMQSRCVGDATPSTLAEYDTVKGCLMYKEEVPAGHELISVNCEAEQSYVVPMLKRESDLKNVTAPLAYSCHCYIPKDLFQPRVNVACSFRMYTCELAQLVT